MMLCKDCQYFKIIYCPIWDSDNLQDWGKAKCRKHNLETHYRNRAKIDRLRCVEECENVN